MTTSTKLVADRFLAAVNGGDLTAVTSCFAPDAIWQNVPHTPVVGRASIRAFLQPIFERSERIRWDLISAAYGERQAWLERVDRFWIDGIEYAVACNGVLEVDTTTDSITELRDYVDLGEWRDRLRLVRWDPSVPPERGSDDPPS